MHTKNNFDFLRLLFASFVIITHSFILSGAKPCDWLCQLTNGQALLSDIGVKGFFIISGFLIFQSLQRSDRLVGFYWKRFLRLFPGLLVMLLLTILLAPFVYQGAVPYAENKSVWMYFINNLSLYRTQYVIDGVFAANPYKSVINGSLWSIPYEFTMYILLSLLFFFRNKIKYINALLLIAFILFVIGDLFFIKQIGAYWYIVSFKLMFELGVFFIAGALLSSSKVTEHKYFDWVAIAAAGVLIISFVLNIYSTVQFFVWPVIIISFGLKRTFIISEIGEKIGDLSYGIYIYGFPVQQTLVHFFGLNYLELIFFGLIISTILAYLSWHLIEAQALKWKKLIA